MSYTILYRTAFLKMSDNTYIPVDETGDSNVWTCDNSRRVRMWSNGWNMFREKPGYTEEEILTAANGIIESTVKEYEGTTEYKGNHVHTREEILRDFGYYSGLRISGHSIMTAGQFLGWFRKGIRNAHTLDEYWNMGVTVRLAWNERTGDSETGRRDRVIATEEELLAEYRDRAAGGCEPYITYGCIPDSTYRTGICPKRERTGKRPDKAFVINISGRGYVQSRTSRRTRITLNRQQAHPYASRGAAAKTAAILERCGYTCTIEETSNE